MDQIGKKFINRQFHKLQSKPMQTGLIQGFQTHKARPNPNTVFKSDINHLKQMWLSNANQQTMRECLLQLKNMNKLPIEYEKAIVEFLFAGPHSQDKDRNNLSTFDGNAQNIKVESESNALNAVYGNVNFTVNQNGNICILSQSARPQNRSSSNLDPSYNSSASSSKNISATWNYSTLSRASQLFRYLDCSNNKQMKIAEYEHFINTETELNQYQIAILYYNLACLAESVGMNGKAERILNKYLITNNMKTSNKLNHFLKQQCEDIFYKTDQVIQSSHQIKNQPIMQNKNNQNQNDPKIKLSYDLNKLFSFLKAKIILKKYLRSPNNLNTNQSSVQVANQQFKSLSTIELCFIQRFKKFTDAQEFLQQSLRPQKTAQSSRLHLPLKTCTLVQLYNLGVSLKASRPQKSLIIFHKVMDQHPSTHISIVTKINISQCYYQIGQLGMAVGVLNKLIESNSYFVQDYVLQLKNKVYTWTKTNEILEIASTYGPQVYAEGYRILSRRQQQGKQQVIRTIRLGNKKLQYKRKKQQQIAISLQPPAALQTDQTPSQVSQLSGLESGKQDYLKLDLNTKQQKIRKQILTQINNKIKLNRYKYPTNYGSLLMNKKLLMLQQKQKELNRLYQNHNQGEYGLSSCRFSNIGNLKNCGINKMGHKTSRSIQIYKTYSQTNTCKTKLLSTMYTSNFNQQLRDKSSLTKTQNMQKGSSFNKNHPKFKNEISNLSPSPQSRAKYDFCISNMKQIPNYQGNKISQFQSLKSFAILSNINTSKNSSPISSKKQILPIDYQILDQPCQSTASPDRESQPDGKWADENLIEHYWTVIKNSKDENQVAEKYLNLGDVYVKERDYESALMVYRRALEKGRLEAYGRIANLYYWKSKYNNAMEYYQKYIKLVTSQDHQKNLKLLHCYSKIPQKYKKASQKLQQILQQNPNDKEAHILYSTVLMKQKHYEKAINECQRFKKINYMCFENLHLMGLLYKTIGKTKEAFSCFVNALRVAPDSVGSLIQLTQLAEIGDFLPQLVDIYRKALFSNRNNHQILQILYMLVRKKQIKLQQVKNSLNFSQLIAIGDFFMQKQMIQQAQLSYKQAGSYTNNTLLKQKLGNLQYQKKNYEEAQKYYKQSQKRKQVFKIQVKLGHSILKQNKFEEAKKIFQECINKQSQNKSICLNMLGQCQYGMGNYSKALERFQESSKYTNNRQINFLWENACRKMIVQDMRKNKIARD